MSKNYFSTQFGQILRRTHALGTRLGLVGLLGLAGALNSQAQKAPNAGFFSDDAGARRAADTSPLARALPTARPLTLDVAGLRAAFATAPPETRVSAQPLVLTLPLPDGTNTQFRVVETTVMEPALAARYPGIRTYTGVGVSDPTATVRLDLTPQGFHAQVLSAATGSFYIDPATRTDTQHYLSFWRRTMPNQEFSCGVESPSATGQRAATSTGTGLRTSGPQLRTLRLALAATGEYTAYHGGTVAAGLAAMVTAVNRVTGVYEKELDVRLILVNNTDLLIYTDPNTDPYTNNNGSTMLGQNQTNITSLIGAANYDIGHVFSTGGGGVAGLGVICRDAQKSRGVTGLTAPVGDAFYIDYVAHEMGHQFGGNHTFNSSLGSCAGGNRSNLHAYEPGSGSTIMAYAGICGADNLQPNSDPYFHVESYEEIQTVLAATTCGTTTTTGNTPPTVTLPAGGKVLPISTPFKLTASGADADGDVLTYDWEEYDRATAATLATAQAAGVAVPLFRSFSPTTSPTRYFPRLNDLLTNTSSLVERLPTVTRPLTFRVTLRDEHVGPAGIIGGLNSSATVSLSSTSAAGPFLVTAPNTAVAWVGNSSQTVTWNVAGTDANGVNCATVNIRLSTDGGLTYPTLLLAGAPNNGSAAITVPNLATTTARLMVEAADNYFFDISNADFAITPAATACAAPTNISVGILRGQAVVSYTPSSTATSYTVTTTPATTTLTVSGGSTFFLGGLTPGTNYTLNLTSNCAGGGTATASAPFAYPASGSLVLTYQTGDYGQPTDNVIRPYLQLGNDGGTPIPYSELTIRYWLTSENASALVPQIDWAQLGTGYVSARYVALPTTRQGAYGYVEYAFLPGAGTLAGGTNSGPIYTSFHKRNWSDFDETDDYSYRPANVFVLNDHITVYQNGTLISGIEPVELAPTKAVKVYAGHQDTSPTTQTVNVALQVANVGSVPVNYQEMTVRYWFTPDGAQSLVYPVDYAVLGASNFSLVTGQQGTETYAEMRFSTNLGILYPQTNTNNIQFRIRKADWGVLTQTNDYSFSGSSAIIEQPRITAYLNGQLVYGTEPTSTATARDGAALTSANVLEGSPNPFTDQVQLRFTLPQSEAYTLTVYDMLGRQLEELSGGMAPAGQAQELVWNAGRYAAGLYLVRLHTASTEQQLKFIKR